MCSPQTHAPLSNGLKASNAKIFLSAVISYSWDAVCFHIKCKNFECKTNLCDHDCEEQFCVWRFSTEQWIVIDSALK